MNIQERLTKALPKGYEFTLHHLSTPPTPCPAIFAAPPGHPADETYRECHFLSVSISQDGRQYQVFAIEVFIYTTQDLTTIFVSKADSTGCLYLLDIPKRTESPLKTIAVSFLQYLISERTRSDRRLLLSLFARAQNQYLFPASIENEHKHVLDDRGLIKWWCLVVDRILGGGEENPQQDGGPNTSATGYLRVPGYDAYGTKTFFPKNTVGGSRSLDRWKVADPLQELSRLPDPPERCLIPRFPDDPKARFLEELDDELGIGMGEDRQPVSRDDLTEGTNSGRWRSIRTLDQFWDAMSFRQECSSGRLVGFLWAVFTPRCFHPEFQGTRSGPESHQMPNSKQSALLSSQHQRLESVTTPSPLGESAVTEAPLTPPRSSKVAQEHPTPTPVKVREGKAIDEQPEITSHYYWPRPSRGEVVLRQKDYDRVGRLLLRLDYATENATADSTQKWINDVAENSRVKSWGKTVVGQKEVGTMDQLAVNGHFEANMLSGGLIRKKKRPAHDDDAQEILANSKSETNTLTAGLVRKKVKNVNCIAEPSEPRRIGHQGPE
ncbi:MAG: hypothetical protein Q9163_000496 [Psora crenata]